MSAQPHLERRSAPCIARGICEITLETADLDGRARFYRAAFGAEVLARQADRIWLACGSHARLGIWSPGTKEFGDRGGRHVHFALSVGPGELTALGERLERMAIEHRGPVEHPGGDRSLYLGWRHHRRGIQRLVFVATDPERWRQAAPGAVVGAS